MGRKKQPQKRKNWGAGHLLKSMDRAVREYNTANLKLSMEKNVNGWTDKKLKKEQNKEIKRIVFEVLYGEGKSTLRRRVGLDTSRNVKFKSAGRPTGLTDEEEAELANWIDEMGKLCMNPNRSIVQAAAKTISHNPNFKAGKKWLKNFLARHPNIK